MTLTQPAAKQVPPRKQIRKLTRPSDYRRAYRRGKKFSGLLLRIYFSPNSLSYPRLGVVAGKRVSKKATERNRHKRVIKEWFRQSGQGLAAGSVDIVVVAASNAKTRPHGFKVLRRELAQLTRQAKRWAQ